MACLQTTVTRVGEGLQTSLSRVGGLQTSLKCVSDFQVSIERQGGLEVSLADANKGQHLVSMCSIVCSVVILEIIRVCFANGYWMNEQPWSNQEGWKND